MATSVRSNRGSPAATRKSPTASSSSADSCATSEALYPWCDAGQAPSMRRAAVASSSRRIGIFRRRDIVQGACDFGAQRIEVGLALRRRVLARAGGFRILIGALPVDRRLRDTDEMQRRRRPVEPADGNREHDSVRDPREVAVADERRAILQKDPVQERFGRQNRGRTRGKRRRHGHGEHDRSQRDGRRARLARSLQQHGRSQPSGTPRARQAFPIRFRLENQIRLGVWKSCGRCVHRLWNGRQIKFFSRQEQVWIRSGALCGCAFVSSFA